MQIKGVLALNQEFEWTHRSLIDEAIANYQSLHGTQVDWLSLELDGYPQELVRIETCEGQVFRFQILVVGDHEANSFDGLFPLL